MAQNQDLNFDEGDDLIYNLTITDDSGVAINLTDFTFYFTCKKKKSDADDNAIFKKTITSIPDALLGKVSLVIDRADTNGQTQGIYPYDIVWKDAGGKKRTIVEGNFKLTKALTEEI